MAQDGDRAAQADHVGVLRMIDQHRAHDPVGVVELRARDEILDFLALVGIDGRGKDGCGRGQQKQVQGRP
ncbi:MAG: hypothetical protein U1F87_13565 [Kiritimatiellia bacterium]